jgi:hypothetical protein
MSRPDGAGNGPGHRHVSGTKIDVKGDQEWPGPHGNSAGGFMDHQRPDIGRTLGLNRNLLA